MEKAVQVCVHVGEAERWRSQVWEDRFARLQKRAWTGMSWRTPVMRVAVVVVGIREQHKMSYSETPQ